MRTMSERHLQLVMPDELSIEVLVSRLHQSMRFSESGPVTLKRTYYDSFDWRLYAHGGVLEAESGNGAIDLLWRALDSGELYNRQPVDTLPRFAWDLPCGPLRKALEPVLEMRVLLPVAWVRSTVRTLHVLNKDEKTVARVLVEENVPLAPGGMATGRHLPRVRVLPVKGYPKYLQQLLQLLESDLGLPPANEDLMLVALGALGRQPADYSSKINVPLDPAMRAHTATKTILRHLLQTLKANEAGVRADLDSECLHDFRVAVRRTRSALAQIRDVFPAEALERFRPAFAWLGDITGPTRDFDVYLLNFDQYKRSLPAAFRDHLDPLRGFLHAHQKKAHLALVAQLDSPRYREVIADWRAFLQDPADAPAGLRNAGRPALVVAGEQIWRVYGHALKQGRAIGAQTPAEALHELRKTCKKLRYLMEFFRSLYPAAEIHRLVKALKTLQDNLGEIQDLQVQMRSLRQISRQMADEVAVDTLMAMGMLVDVLATRQRRARAAFRKRFAKFAAAENRDLFKALFAQSPAQQASRS